MRLLEVFPTYPGDRYDGSAVYLRALNNELVKRGVEVRVLCTRARRLRHLHEFAIAWPNELPSRDVHEGVGVRRFATINSERLGRRASYAISRRWSREGTSSGVVLPGSAHFISDSIARARSRPRRFDLLADIARGPLAPELIVHLWKWARLYDVILVGYAPFSLHRQVLAAMRGRGVPVVLLPFMHETDWHHLFQGQLEAYERASAVLTLTAHTSEFLRTYAPRSSPVTLGAGVTVRERNGDGGALFRSRYGLGDRPMLLFVGRKEKGKQYAMAVRAVERLPRDAVLVIVGRDVDGEAIVSDRVRYLGILSDDELAQAYEACDIFVLPSLFESFGMVFLDAWIRGKPVIGNRNCGASAALIEDGADGFLCSDADGIADAAGRLLEDAELRARLGAAGRQKTLTDYTWERVADRAMEAITSVIAKSTSNAR